MVMGGCPLAQE